MARRRVLHPFGPADRHPSGLGIAPLTEQELNDGLDQGVHDALVESRLVDRTPLWFFVLRESEMRNDGKALGPVGSRIVAETIAARSGVTRGRT